MKILKIFFFQITGPISTKLSTKHHLVNEIQTGSIKGTLSFLKVDDNETGKMNSQCLRVVFSRTAGPESTKLGTYHLLVRIHGCSEEEQIP